MSVAAFRSAAAARYTVVEAPSGLAYRLRPFNTLATIAAGRPSLVSAAVGVQNAVGGENPESVQRAVANLFALAVVSSVAAFKATGSDVWQDLKVSVDGAEGTIGIEELDSIGDFDTLAAAAIKAAGLSDSVSLRPRDSGSP